MARQSYHHGDLRKAFLDAAVEVIGESGTGAMSLRELARRAGVSHAASQHHFGDKAGLLTAVACQGYELLAEALRQAGDELLDVGVAYVDFAVTHRAHFEVMFQPGLYHADAPEVRAARERAGLALAGGLADAGPTGPRVPARARGRVVDRARLRHAVAGRCSARGPGGRPRGGRPPGDRASLRPRRPERLRRRGLRAVPNPVGTVPAARSGRPRPLPVGACLDRPQDGDHVGRPVPEGHRFAEEGVADVQQR